MKKVVPLLICLLVGRLVFAQPADWRKGYDHVEPFGKAFIVSKAGKMGLVEPSGKPLTRLVFDGIDILDRGFADAKIDGMQVYLSDTGRIVGTKPYLDVLNLWISPPYPTVGLPGWASQYRQVIPTAGRYIGYQFLGEEERVHRGKKSIVRHIQAQLLGAGGRPLTPIWYDAIQPFSYGRAAAKRNKKWGYLDSLGQEVIPFKYDEVSTFSEGLAVVNGWVIDRTGRKRFPNQTGYTAWEGFRGNLCEVSVEAGQPGAFNDPTRPRWGHRYNYIDHAGNFLIPFRYDSIKEYEQGLLRIVWKDGRGKFLDSLAQEQHSERFEAIEAYVYFPDPTDSRPGEVGLRYGWPGHRRVRQDSRYGFIDMKTGQMAIPCRYQTTLPNAEGRIWVKAADRWGLLDSVGHEIVPPRLAFDTVYDFHEGLALVRDGYRYGYVNRSGRLAIPLRFWQADEFRNGKASARTWLRRGTLNQKGQWLRSSVAAEWFLVLVLLLVGSGFWAWQRWETRRVA